MTQLYLTDSQAVALGLDPTDSGLQAKLQDAADLYDYIDAQRPVVTRAQLDKWATETWGPSNPGVTAPGTVDRLNGALSMLIAAGRVFDFQGTLKTAQAVAGA